MARETHRVHTVQRDIVVVDAAGMRVCNCGINGVFLTGSVREMAILAHYSSAVRAGIETGHTVPGSSERRETRRMFPVAVRSERTKSRDRRIMAIEAEVHVIRAFEHVLIGRAMRIVACQAWYVVGYVIRAGVV